MPPEIGRRTQTSEHNFTAAELMTYNASPAERVQIINALANLKNLERDEIQALTDRIEGASIEETQSLVELIGKLKLQNQQESEAYHKRGIEASNQKHLQMKENWEMRFLSILRVLTVIIGVGFTTLGWYYQDDAVNKVGLFVLGVGIFPLAPELVKAVLIKKK
ncbi:MAG TPA: hypothetical protein VF648_06425 [Pyrinomonadaceae bacterium]|jgi:hypothetical protein